MSRPLRAIRVVVDQHETHPAGRDALRSTGVVVRHSVRCSGRTDIRCDCRPSFQAQAWSPRDKRQVRKTFKTLAEARRWRQNAQVAIRRQELRAPSDRTLELASDKWLAAARRGTIRTRSGDPYKPSAIRSYQSALNSFVLPAFGSKRLSALTRNHVQDFVDDLVAEGRAPSTVRNAVLPLRAIYRRATDREEVVVNPTERLSLPSDRHRRDRVAMPTEAQALLNALPERDRGLWATAFFAGLRRGELMALRWEYVDLDAGVLDVEHSWDRVAGLIDPKSRSGRRRVPIPSQLRAELIAHRLRQGVGGTGFVFSICGDHPLDLALVAKRAKKLWRAAELNPICLHDARHTYASFMIAAGVNAKALSTYMGHSSITVTLDRYGHLMPGNEREAAGLLDAYLERSKEPRPPPRSSSVRELRP